MAALCQKAAWKDENIRASCALTHRPDLEDPANAIAADSYLDETLPPSEAIKPDQIPCNAALALL